MRFSSWAADSFPRCKRLVGLSTSVILLLVLAGLPTIAQEGNEEKAHHEAKTEAQSAEATPAVYKAPKVTSDELQAILESKETLFLLDVRRPEELATKGTLPGYVNIPVEELEERIAEIPKDAQIISACNTGNRAGKAAAILEKHGYRVKAVCGLKGWTVKGWELIYPEAPPKADEKTASEEAAKKPSL